MLGLFIFSLALIFLASPAVRNQVKPVEKEAEVQHQRLAVLYSGIGVTLSSAVIGKKHSGRGSFVPVAMFWMLFF